MPAQPLYPSAPAIGRIALGSSTFGREIQSDDAFLLMDRALARGVSHFDTAATYTAGVSETIMGQWLASRRPSPESLMVATKIYPPYTPDAIDTATAASARRLGVDVIDLLYLHKWDAAVETPETLAALDGLVRSGRVRALGASNFNAQQLGAALTAQAAHGWARFRVLQNNNNLAVRDVDPALVTLAGDHALAIVTYSPIAAGFLTGKHQKGAPTADTRFTIGGGTAERYQERYWQDQMFATLDALRGIAAEADMTVAQLAIAWQFTRPTITSPIIGASKPEQLVDAVNAVRTPLSAELTKRLDVLTHEYRFGDSAR